MPQQYFDDTNNGFEVKTVLDENFQELYAKNTFGTSPNYSEFEADGTLVFHGNATVWNDINFEGNHLGSGASAPDLITAFGSGNIQLRGFDGNVTLEQLYGGGEILHDYKEGTDLVFHVHWLPTTTDVGVVKWQLEYNWQNIDGTYSAPTTITATSDAGETAWKHNKVAFSAITGTGKLIGSHFVFRIFRDPADVEDTYPGDAALLSVGVHYETDTCGSRQITTK